MEGRFNLAGFTHGVMSIKRKDGTSVRCVVIPIEENHITETEKGNLNVYFKTWPIDNRRGQDTEWIKQNLKKEVREKLKAEGKYPPTLGAIVESEPQQAETADTSLQTPEPVAGEDLPF